MYCCTVYLIEFVESIYELEFIKIKLAKFLWPIVYFTERLMCTVSTVIEINVRHTGGPAQL